MPWCLCGGQRTAFRDQFSASAMCAPGVKLRGQAQGSGSEVRQASLPLSHLALPALLFSHFPFTLHLWASILPSAHLCTHGIAMICSQVFLLCKKVSELLWNKDCLHQSLALPDSAASSRSSIAGHGCRRRDGAGIRSPYHLLLVLFRRLLPKRSQRNVNINTASNLILGDF